MPSGVVNLAEKFAKFSEFWSPRVVAEMNDYQFKVAKFEGEFIWHDHKDTDEVFLVISGSMGIEFRDGMVHLSEGEMYVVPRGVEHKPFANSECHVLLIEPQGVVNTGDEGGDLKAENDVWV
ncbi:MAG: cupin domain-containing protein [Pseudomonadota bacterium]